MDLAAPHLDLFADFWRILPTSARRSPPRLAAGPGGAGDGGRRAPGRRPHRRRGARVGHPSPRRAAHPPAGAGGADPAPPLSPEALIDRRQARGGEQLRAEEPIWLIVGGSDRRTPHAQAMAGLQRVKPPKGSGAVPGYRTLNAIGLGPPRRGLLSHTRFSSAAADFLSESREAQTAMRSVAAALAPRDATVTAIGVPPGPRGVRRCGRLGRGVGGRLAAGLPGAAPRPLGAPDAGGRRDPRDELARRLVPLARVEARVGRAEGGPAARQAATGDGDDRGDAAGRARPGRGAHPPGRRDHRPRCLVGRGGGGARGQRAVVVAGRPPGRDGGAGDRGLPDVPGALGDRRRPQGRHAVPGVGGRPGAGRRGGPVPGRAGVGGGGEERANRPPGKIVSARGLRRRLALFATEAILADEVPRRGALPPRIAAWLGRPPSG